MLTCSDLGNRILPMSIEQQFDYIGWPPEGILTKEQQAKLTTADIMIAKTVLGFCSERHIEFNMEARTKKPRVEGREYRRDRLPPSWTGTMLYDISVGNPDDDATGFTIEYYLHGNTHEGDARDMGTVSSSSPLWIRMPQELADRVGSLAIHQKLPLSLVRDYRVNPNTTAMGLVGVYGAATEENVRTLLDLNMEQPANF